MPRRPRQGSPTGVYHFITRGVNKKRLFHDKKDFQFYMALMLEYKEKLKIEIYHYCLMSNHTHLLVKTEDLVSLSQFGHFLQRRYAYYYCKTRHWSEQVFRSRFLSVSVDTDAYLLECGRYIERNPLEAGLVKDLRDYSYSSYLHYAYAQESPLITDSPLYQGLAEKSEERQLIYRFYISHDRDNQLPKRKPFRKLHDRKQFNETQPVPF